MAKSLVEREDCEVRRTEDFRAADRVLKLWTASQQEWPLRNDVDAFSKRAIPLKVTFLLPGPLERI